VWLSSVVAPMQMNVIPTSVGSSTSSGTISKKKDKSKKKKQPLTKNDIGAPTNFQFVYSPHFFLIISHMKRHAAI